MRTQKSKVFKNLIKEEVVDDIYEEDVSKYINILKDKIDLITFPCKLKLCFACEFTSPTENTKPEISYSHPIEIIKTENNLRGFYSNLVSKFDAWIDGFQERGSGLVFDKILSVEIKQYKIGYLRASSYIPLQFKSSNIINVKNLNDTKCFVWSILSKLFPANDHKDRISNYTKYESKLNMDGIEYPVSIKDIPKVEKQNNLSINVFSLKDPRSKTSLYPVFESDFKSGMVIDLLYIESNNNTHYCLIKNLDSFLCVGMNKLFTCRHCLQGFGRQKTLDEHREICLNHGACKVKMPAEGKNILEFKNYHFKEKLPITIYCDFEANNMPINTSRPDPNSSYVNNVFKQEVNSYGIYVKSDHPHIFESEYFSYVGNDAKEKFVEKIVDIYDKIMYRIFKNEKKEPSLSKQEEKEFQEATSCYICGKESKEKIREHNHFTGDYRGAACLSCNAKEGKVSKIIPVFFHNGSNYDFHFIIEELKKYENEFDKVSTLSKNSEEYIAIEFGTRFRKLRFLDSYRFFTKSLSDVAKSLKEFPILEKEFNSHEGVNLLKRKGVYPYEYVDSIDKLNDKKLPSKDKKHYRPKNKKLLTNTKHPLYKHIKKWVNYRRTSDWFSTLKQEDITEGEYDHAQNVWEKFKCKTLKDYHKLYLKTDILILADAFEQFRDFFLKNHEIDPCYCFSAPGLTWQCGLKYTGVKLELLTDYDMLLMFEEGIRGGFSGVLGPRYVKANNKYLDDHDPSKESNHLLYLDATNLYGWAMSQKLPTNDFRWEKDRNYYKNIPEGRGCIVECDLEYPNDCKFKTANYPLAPERMITKEDMLSDYQLNILEKLNGKLGKEEKLLLTGYDKKKYVVHHSILKEYIKLGLKVTKVYRTISFEESNWLKPYIDFNTEQRKKGKTDFEKDLWKLMNNSFYGKTMENIRNRCEILIESNPEDIKKHINKPNFKDSVIFNDNLVAIINNITSVTFNKPIYLGQVILDHSKQLMYKFYYDVVNKLWPDNEVVASDTDSMFLSIKTEDMYEDMKQILDELDTSDYPKDHMLYSDINKKVIGKFKDELKGEIMKEIVFLRSKAYSYLTPEKGCKRLKGIGRSTVEKEIKHDEYKNTLFNGDLQLNKMYRLNSDKHNMYIKEVNKISLSPFDDKRYICDDGINTLPYGINGDKKMY